ncbi:MAG: NADH-quinone oxidoreductase subunit C [Anaerolineaceae bacterium]|nr:NADH-quinone oxidoreductase subunit C [Anaerolineaceae bacterium]
MDTQTALTQAQELLQQWTDSTAQPEAHRLDVKVSRENFKAAITAVKQAKWGYLAAITGLDVPATEEAEGQVEGLYQFCEGAAVLTIRVAAPYSEPYLPSICDLIPVATLYEREFIEMFGVFLEGTPNTERLLLADDWPVGVYPLRKSFTGFDSPDEA